MLAQRVLFVKLSSLGDVIHHMPAVTDLHVHRPDLSIDWAAEEGYVPLLRLHCAVNQPLPVALRRLKGSPLAPEAWAAMEGTRKRLADQRYEWIIDSQGLLKSLAIARMARGPVFGFDQTSAREKLASRFYDVGVRVPRNLHAVDRIRLLVGAVFGYRPTGEPDYGLVAPDESLDWAPRRPYIVALHASSRREKSWPTRHWLSLAENLRQLGFVVIYPGGSDEERLASNRLAAGNDNALAAPPMGLPEAATLLSRASAVIGVDTGLTHLSVAMGTPTVGLYVSTRPGLTGLRGSKRAVNLGGPGILPTVDDVMTVLFGSPVKK